MYWDYCWRILGDTKTVEGASDFTCTALAELALGRILVLTAPLRQPDVPILSPGLAFAAPHRPLQALLDFRSHGVWKPALPLYLNLRLSLSCRPLVPDSQTAW